MHPLDRLLRDQVDPALRGLAFRRRQRRYERTSDDGRDVAILEVELKSAHTPGLVEFTVQGGLVLETSRAFFAVHRGEAGLSPVALTFGLRTEMILPPPLWFRGRIPDFPERDPLWGFDSRAPGQADACGQELAASLAERWGPRLLGWLDRRLLLADLLAQDPARPVLHSQLPQQAGLLWAGIESEPVERIETWLGQYEAVLARTRTGRAATTPAMRRWVQDRLDRRHAAAGS